jgi:hypothetical protein
MKKTYDAYRFEPNLAVSFPAALRQRNLPTAIKSWFPQRSKKPQFGRLVP